MRFPDVWRGRVARHESARARHLEAAILIVADLARAGLVKRRKHGLGPFLGDERDQLFQGNPSLGPVFSGFFQTNALTDFPVHTNR